eukprot:5825665-Prymnesium_polylepis.1
MRARGRHVLSRSEKKGHAPRHWSIATETRSASGPERTARSILRSRQVRTVLRSVSTDGGT